MKKINVAVLGAGRIAMERHIPEYANNESVTLSGYYDLCFERAEQMAKKYGGKAYRSVTELLSDKNIDAVSICTANSTHAELAINALTSGKHVLCEKPMAASAEECEKMIAAAKAAGKKLMIAHNQRFMNVHIKAKELLDSGIIGKVISFSSAFMHSGPDNWSVDQGTGNWFFKKSKARFGALADLGIHKIDLINYLLESPISEVYAAVETLDKRYSDGEYVDVDDNAVILCKTVSGALGTVSASWTNYGSENNSTVIYGSSGVMKIDPGKRNEMLTVEKCGKKTVFEVEKEKSSQIIDAFVSSVVNDTPIPVSGEDAYLAMRAVFAAEKSNESNACVRLDGIN